jgi:cell division septation protein DedD
MVSADFTNEDCPRCHINYAVGAPRDGPSSSIIHGACDHWLCTDCWTRLYEEGVRSCPVCKMDITVWITTRYPLSNDDDEEAEEHSHSCTYDPNEEHHPIDAKHYSAFDPETGGTFKVESITRNGDWQINLRSDGGGMLIGQNGLNRPMVEAIMRHLKLQGQPGVTQLLKQLDEKADKANPNSVNAKKRRLDTTGKTQCHSLPEGVQIECEFFSIQELEKHLEEDATASGHCQLTLGNWTFVRYVDDDTHHVMYEVLTHVEKSGSVSRTGRVLQKVYAEARDLVPNPKQNQPKQNQPKQDKPKQDKPKQDKPEEGKEDKPKERPTKKNKKRGRDEEESAASTLTEVFRADLIDVNDERFSRRELLLQIARDLAPTLIKNDHDVSFDQQQMRAIDKAFAAWPVRYATPSWVGYHVPLEDEGREEKSIGFTWLGPCDVFGHDENVEFQIYEDGKGCVEVEYSEWLSS